MPFQFTNYKQNFVCYSLSFKRDYEIFVFVLTQVVYTDKFACVQMYDPGVRIRSFSAVSIHLINSTIIPIFVRNLHVYHFLPIYHFFLRSIVIPIDKRRYIYKIRYQKKVQVRLWWYYLNIFKINTKITESDYIS